MAKGKGAPPPANPALILVTSLQSPHPLPASVSNGGNSARKAPRHRSDSARSHISSRAASRSENWTDEGGEKKEKKTNPTHPNFLRFRRHFPFPPRFLKEFLQPFHSFVGYLLFTFSPYWLAPVSLIRPSFTDVSHPSRVTDSLYL